MTVIPKSADEYVGQPRPNYVIFVKRIRIFSFQLVAFDVVYSVKTTVVN